MKEINFVHNDIFLSLRFNLFKSKEIELYSIRLFEHRGTNVPDRISLVIRNNCRR